MWRNRLRNPKCVYKLTRMDMIIYFIAWRRKGILINLTWCNWKISSLNIKWIKLKEKDSQISILKRTKRNLRFDYIVKWVISCKQNITYNRERGNYWRKRSRDKTFWRKTLFPKIYLVVLGICKTQWTWSELKFYIGNKMSFWTSFCY